MIRLHVLGALTGVMMLLTVAEAPAAPVFRRPVYRPVVRPYFPPNRMPGWDWQYTYPYSAYNLARRYYPYPYPVPYPVYTPPVTTVSGYDSNPNYIPQPQDVLIPQATWP